MPKSNVEFWTRKLARNEERDAETEHALRENGWAVIRVWEHEPSIDAADRVERLVRARHPRPSTSRTA